MTQPPCPHFGTCGGCALQHLADATYIAEKTALLQTALRRAGFADNALSQPARTAQASAAAWTWLCVAGRRRCTRPASATQHGSRRSDRLALCCIRHWSRCMPPLREVLARLQAFRRESSVIANLLDSRRRSAGAHRCAACVVGSRCLDRVRPKHRLPRIAWALGSDEPEPIAMLRPPTTSLSGITVVPPSGGFLQASTTGETAIIAAVLAALPAKGRIAELFAGCGAITFALAQCSACRRMGGRHGIGIRSAHRRQSRRSCRPHRGEPARPGASAAAGKGTRGVCRRRAQPAFRRRRSAGGTDRRGETAGRRLCKLQPSHAVARREAAAAVWLHAAVSDTHRSVSLVDEA